MRFFVRSLALASFAALGASSFAQLRVANWNVSNWNVTSTTNSRYIACQHVIYDMYQGRQMAPDILMIEEITSSAGLSNFKTLLNTAPGSPGDWQMAPYVTGPDTTVGFYYRTSKVHYIATTLVSVAGDPPEPPRNTYRFDVYPVGFAVDKATIACYPVHEKAGSDTGDEPRRAIESNNIRTNIESLNQNWSFIVGGDFNARSSSDDGIANLVQSRANNNGRCWDPINRLASWYQNSTYKYIHTQDPWNGVNTGGMDDRFDILFVSDDLIDGLGMDYLGNYNSPYSNSTWDDPNHSYRCWGNDGNSYNVGLSTTANEMVGPSIASYIQQSLGNQTGHLPVFMDMLVPATAAVDTTFYDFGYVRQNSIASKNIVVSDTGNTALWGASGIGKLSYSFAAQGKAIVPLGTFTDTIAPSGNTHAIRLDTSVPGKATGTVSVLTNDPVNPKRTIQIQGVVVGTLPPR